MIVLDAQGWTEWGAWSECSATCGISLKERTRQCDDHTCKGESIGMAKCVVPQCVAYRDSISSTTFAASSDGVSTTGTALSSDTEPKPGKDKIIHRKIGTDKIPDYRDKGELVISI